MSLPARHGHLDFSGRDAGVQRVEVPDGCHLSPGQTFTTLLLLLLLLLLRLLFIRRELQLRVEKQPLSSLQL